MSLTSYRAAPPRAKMRAPWPARDREIRCSSSGLAASYSPTSSDAVQSAQRHLTAEFGMGSGVLLALWPPDRKRNTTSADAPYGRATEIPACFRSRPSLTSAGSDQAYRAISTGQLNALLRLHLRPIDVVVFHGPQGYLVSRGASRLDAFSGYPVRS